MALESVLSSIRQSSHKHTDSCIITLSQ